MTAWLLMAAACLLLLLVLFVPGVLIVRALGGSPVLAWALAPSIAAAVAAVGAVLAGAAGLRWSLLPFALLALAAGGAALLARRVGLRLHEDGGPVPWPALLSAPLRGPVLLTAAYVAVGPTLLVLRRPDGVLERWDALYHLSALARIRENGDASSLTLGALSNTDQTPVFYPAAFHDLASLVPGVPVPIVLNAAALTFAVAPWVLGTALLAHVLWPQERRGPFLAALGALLVPAAPVNEWIHLSAMPNLSGFSMLPGLLAASVLLWREVLAASQVRIRTIVATAVVLGAGGLGLALLQPNVAVMALILLIVLTAVTGGPHWRARPVLLAVPVLAYLPIALLTWTPIGATVTTFVGGLQVPFLTGLGEILLGLHTVWPMALGVGLALLWWPGLVRTAGDAVTRWVAVAWVVVAVLYLDAAVDSPLDLSVLFYRGQDRISMPLAMLCVLLVVPGVRAWQTMIERRSASLLRPLAAVAVLLAIALVGASLPVRHANAERNLAADYPGRGRFLQADEREAFDRIVPGLPRGTVLASPFSGGSHLYGLHGMPVHFPVAGMSFTERDRRLVYSVERAAEDPAYCRNLENAGIMYVYQDHLAYQHVGAYAPLNRADPGFGEIVLSTSHSQLVRVDCDALG